MKLWQEFRNTYGTVFAIVFFPLLMIEYGKFKVMKRLDKMYVRTYLECDENARED